MLIVICQVVQGRSAYLVKAGQYNQSLKKGICVERKMKKQQPFTALRPRGQPRYAALDQNTFPGILLLRNTQRAVHCETGFLAKCPLQLCFHCKGALATTPHRNRLGLKYNLIILLIINRSVNSIYTILVNNQRQ